MSDEARLTEIEARARAATPGPWRVEPMLSGIVTDGVEYPGDGCVLQCMPFFAFRRDAPFIAHARQDIPWLISRLEETTALLGVVVVQRDRLLRRIEQEDL